MTSVVELVDPPAVARVRVRARRAVLWLRHVWSGGPSGAGVAIPHGEVDRILDDGADHARARAAFYVDDPAARELAPMIRDADTAAAADPVLARLRREFALDDAELDMLALVVAVEGDPWLRRAIGYLHDDANCGSPTPWLASQLFDWAPGTRLAPESNLVGWRFARPIDGQSQPWSVTAGWSVDSSVAAWLLHGASIDHALGTSARLVAPARDHADDSLYPVELATIATFVRALRTAPESREIVVIAPRGAGKRTLAVQLCALLQQPLVVADAGVLLGPSVAVDSAREALVRIHRVARFVGAAIYWHDADLAPWSHRPPAPAPLVLFGATGPFVHPVDDGVVRRTVRLPSLTQAERVRLWSKLATVPVPAPVRDWPLLPADLVRAAAMAPAGPEAVADACRATLRLDAGALVSSLARPYAWDDLVLSPMLRRHLEELESQARLRWSVYEDWGFGRFLPMGRGITALFAGPSGTGKTMAAQVIARALDMELYRVDLAGVMSKYIGDTEKNLRQVFDTCERANVLLFFDEADALFGQRMQTKDAHDRFANIEIDYLLQRMEQFDGVAVLATNRKHEIDSAFLRRIRFIIDFLPPGIAERCELWTRALPLTTPGGEPLLDAIDFRALAERLTMTGADIKSAAIGAAFLARSEGVRIGMRHVMRASRRELAKHGLVVRAGDLEAG